MPLYIFRNTLTIIVAIACTAISIMSALPADVSAAPITHQFTLTNNLIPRDLGNPEYTYDEQLIVCFDTALFTGGAIRDVVWLSPGETQIFSVAESNDVRTLVYFDPYISYHPTDQCYSHIALSSFY